MLSRSAQAPTGDPVHVRDRDVPHAARHTVGACANGGGVHARLRAGPHAAPLSSPHAARTYRMLTARETINPIVISDTTDWTPITDFAIGVSGIVSVGENAVLLVSDTYR
jgi:hypothetical protein